MAAALAKPLYWVSDVLAEDLQLVAAERALKQVQLASAAEDEDVSSQARTRPDRIFRLPAEWLPQASQRVGYLVNVVGLSARPALSVSLAKTQFPTQHNTEGFV